MSDLVNYAKRELSMLGDDEDGMQNRINNDILEIIEIFAKQGHSGFTASYTLNILKRLLAYKPIKPLTGDAAEWSEPLGNIDESKQNLRCYSVFLQPDGIAYDNNGVRVSDDGGITWFYGRKNITFPYYPPDDPEKVYIECTDESKTSFDIITDDPDRIKALHDRKVKEYGKGW